MSAVHDTIQARRTTQDFSADPVDESIVQRALQAAHAAPCHKLTWPWRFTRVGPSTRGSLFEVGLRLKSTNGPLDDRLRGKLHAKMCDPAALIVVGQVLADDPFRRQEDFAATACAIQNLCLSLTADGVGSKWGTGGVTRHPDTYALLGIDPAREQIVGFVWIGMPCRKHVAPPRPPVTEHIRHTE